MALASPVGAPSKPAMKLINQRCRGFCREILFENARPRFDCDILLADFSCGLSLDVAFWEHLY